jgi:hypothetical protein
MSVDCSMEYIGCNALSTVETISSESVTPEKFFVDYISTRKPVKFTRHLNDAGWKVSKELWTHDYLRIHCPKNMLLKVEQRSSEDRFGQGNEHSMTFHDFLAALEQGAESLYLTTQDLGIDTEGRPNIMADPLTHLRHDFPLVPELLQSLVVANVNLWYGQTKAYTTSGLHHDYHDNLYIMLKGEKLITLYPPSEAQHLYTTGDLVKVHSNGRINYKGQITRADGADLQADKAFDAAQKLKAAARRLTEVS